MYDVLIFGTKSRKKESRTREIIESFVCVAGGLGTLGIFASIASIKC